MAGFNSHQEDPHPSPVDHACLGHHGDALDASLGQLQGSFRAGKDANLAGRTMEERGAHTSTSNNQDEKVEQEGGRESMTDEFKAARAGSKPNSTLLTFKPSLLLPD